MRRTEVGICRVVASCALLFQRASGCGRNRLRVQRGLFHISSVKCFLTSSLLRYLGWDWGRGIAKQTSQTINSPLLKLLQRNIRRWRHDIEVQSMLVFEILVCGCRELFLAVVDIVPPFGINACEILSDHPAQVSNSPIFVKCSCFCDS